MPLGEKALNNMSVSIVLLVTPTVQEMECKEEEKQQHSLQQLDRAGIKTKQLPKEVVESGDSEAIHALSKWYGYLETLQKEQSNNRICQLEDLLTQIKEWHMNVASKYCMAPAAVLAEHTMVFTDVWHILSQA